jgi:hypothetical protein
MKEAQARPGRQAGITSEDEEDRDAGHNCVRAKDEHVVAKGTQGGKGDSPKMGALT